MDSTADANAASGSLHYTPVVDEQTMLDVADSGLEHDENSWNPENQADNDVLDHHMNWEEETPREVPPGPRSSHYAEQHRLNDAQDEAEDYEILELTPVLRNGGETFTVDTKRGTKRRFILRRTLRSQKPSGIMAAPEAAADNNYSDRYDYEKKYPADEPQEAMDPNARIWRVYLDEAGAYDTEMIENYKDTVDVILVFAGLFSAVVTTLAVQSSTFLQLDYSQVMASILLEQLAIQRAVASGQAIPEPLTSTLTLNSSTSTSSDRWVNGLWFTSLAFSLATALIGVLVKQWIQAYTAPVSGTPRAQARLRQFRFIGLHKWHVPLIIGLLPTLLHLSLLLFLVGLVVFLFNLDHAVASVIASVSILSYAIYLVTNILPLFDPQCPYRTPLSTYAYTLLHPHLPALQTVLSQTGHASQFVRDQLVLLLGLLFQTVRWFMQTLKPVKKLAIQVCYSRQKRTSASGQDLDSLWGSDVPSAGSSASTLKEKELSAIDNQADQIDARSISWLAQVSSNPSVQRVVVQAVGSLRIGFQAKAILRDQGVLDIICSSFRSCFENYKLRDGRAPRQLSQSLHAHHRLGLGLTRRGVPTLTCQNEKQPDCQSLFMIGLMPNEAYWKENPIKDQQRLFGPVLFRPLPQEVLDYYDPFRPLHDWLNLLRLSSLYYRAKPEARSKAEDWPVCYRLLCMIHLESPTDNLDLLREVLVPVYLSSQFHSPLENEPPALRSILTDELPSDVLVQHRDLWPIRVGFCASFLAGILCRFRESPSAVQVGWWEEFMDALERLGDVVETHSTFAKQEPGSTTKWLSGCLEPLRDGLVELFLQASRSSSTLPGLSLISLAFSMIYLNPSAHHLPQLPLDILPQLMHLLTEELQRLDRSSASEYSYSRVSIGLSKLLDAGNPEELLEIFESLHVLSIFERLCLNPLHSRSLVVCTESFIRQAVRCADRSTEREHRLDRLFANVMKMCPWYSSVGRKPRYELSALVEVRPFDPVWDEIVAVLKTWKDDCVFLQHLEQKLKEERTRVRNGASLGWSSRAGTIGQGGKSRPTTSRWLAATSYPLTFISRSTSSREWRGRPTSSAADQGQPDSPRLSERNAPPENV